jgi:hypothetical protein
MSRRRKIWLYIAGGAGATFLLLVIAGIFYGNRLEPIARDKLVEYLSEKFESDVELADLNLRMFPRVHVVGKGLKFRWKRRTDIPPMIELGEFSFVMSWREMTAPTKHISLVKLKDFQLNMPPKENVIRPAKPGEKAFVAEPVEIAAPQEPKPGALVIDEMIADRTILRILPRDPEKPVGTFELYELRLYEVGAGRPMKYRTRMKNYKPPGMIDCTGLFGPWVGAEPGASPVSGDYDFKQADLGVFKGIAGILEAGGKFDGQLQSIDVNGYANVPEFRLSYAGGKVPLATKYHAVVDGTSGNTFLKRVDATLGKTPMVVSGDIVGEKDVKGKEIELDALIQNGRLEDVLQLAVKGGAPMRGGISMKSKIFIPRGEVDVIDKIGLRGTFRMSGVRFTNPEIQSKIDEFSRRASKQDHEAMVAQARSTFDSSFAVRNSNIRVNNFKYGVPGVEVELDGTYGMRSEEMDFAGVLRLDAKVSQMFTGVKSVALKAFDPFVSRKNKGTVVSIKIGGTREHPKYGLDFGRTFKKKDQ